MGSFLQSFQGLQVESQNGELSISGILKRRDGNLVIQVDIPQDIDKGNFEQAFFQKYEQERKLLEQKHQKQLEYKEVELQCYREQKTDLMELVKVVANRTITVEAKAVSYGDIKQQGNFGIGINQGEIKDNVKAAGILNEAQQQSLTEAITEAQSILKNFSQTYPDDATAQGIKTIEAIEARPSLKQKLLMSAQQGGLVALEKAFDNPAGAFIITAVKTWIKN